MGFDHDKGDENRSDPNAKEIQVNYRNPKNGFFHIKN